ncbi:hypothetical protein [uncultured Methylobacterium sp.]|uniref:hypothetical protein n=1 Tax=uncultured Methylobacterium sp. TaxID=157278 RepID=UPI0035CA07A3
MLRFSSGSRNIIYKYVFSFALLLTYWIIGTSASVAQEKCFSDAKTEIIRWIDENDKELISYAEQMENVQKEGKNPADIWIKYNGVDMPLNVVYQLVSAKYGKASRAAVEQSVEKSRSCAKDVQLPRAAYGVAREYFGLTTVLPEAATRFDFAEIKAGNIFGGSDALVPKGLEDARKVTEKAFEDT